MKKEKEHKSKMKEKEHKKEHMEMSCKGMKKPKGMKK
jgi:hypothetical protein